MALAEWTDQQVLDQLDSGWYWYGATITYAFPVSANNIYSYDWETDGFRALSSGQQQYAKLAIATWDDLMAPTLVQTTSSDSDIEFGFTNVDIDYAHAYYPDAGSVWFSLYYGDLLVPQVGEHGFLTYVHEIGHALGLDHMGDYNGDGYWTPSSYQDSTVLSIMSYFGPNWGYGEENGEGLVAWADWDAANGWTYAPQTPMVNDIMAIQAIYGIDTTTRTGDSVYGFGSNITGQLAKIYDFSLNRTPILTLYDAGGIDTLNLGGWTTASIIDLAPGAYSSCNSMTYNIAIAYTCDIENAVGGAGNDSIRGNLLANRLDGGKGNDQLYGLDGDDTLIGGLGADTMIGGNGDDIYYIDNAQDVVTEASAAGTDEVRSTISHTLATNFEHLTLLGSAALNATGNAANNRLTGNDGANVLDGGTGADTLIGGKGNDIYVVDNLGDDIQETSTLATEIDTVEASLSWELVSTNLENLTLTGSADFDATGNSRNNTLKGNSGNNRLDGVSGADIMLGMAGNDTYVVNSVDDKVYETTLVAGTFDAGGNDTVEASISYALGAFVENLVLTGSANINGSGNGLGNTITGNTGNNILDGKAGADTLDGGDGSDLYLIGLASDHANGEAIEDTGAGISDIDEIRFAAVAASTLTLNSNTSGIERVVIGTGSGAMAISTGTVALNVNAAAVGYALNITGNAGANILTGTDHDDTINGGAGNDRLQGGAGTDVLYGGAGNDWLEHVNDSDNPEHDPGEDTLYGGTGNDTYVIDEAGATIVELTGEGTDIVLTHLNNFVLGDNIENLHHDDEDDVDFTGTGNSLNNWIRSTGGNDSLFGLAGNDKIEGGAGDDLLNGGTGADVMLGGAGNDTYVVDTIGDKVYETTLVAGSVNAGGNDTVESSISYALGAFVENLVLTGAANINGTGNTLGNTITGNAGNNVLNGGAGNDTLSGGEGNDLLQGGLGLDLLIGGEGNDIFRFDTVLKPAVNVDIIQDFFASADIFQLENSIFNKLTTTGQLSDAYFKSGDEVVALDTNDYILYDTSSGALYYDADGSGAVAAIQFATLIGQPPVNHTDFFIT